MGEDISIRFAVVRPDGPPTWHSLPHSRFDGIGAFTELLAARGAAGHRVASPPTSARRPFLSVLGCWVRHLFSARTPYLFESGGRAHVSGGPPPAIACALLPQEATARLVAASRAQSTTVTALLLHHLSAVVRQHLVGGRTDLAWMLPVDLRGTIELERAGANHSSFVEVVCHEGDEPSTVGQRAVRAVKRGEPWANFCATQLGVFLTSGGRRFFMARHMRGPRRWVGQFSNLGVWEPSGSHSEPVWWAFCPPASTSQPIGAGCVTFAGRTALALQLHPSVSTDPSVATRLVNDWATRFTPRAG